MFCTNSNNLLCKEEWLRLIALRELFYIWNSYTLFMELTDSIKNLIFNHLSTQFKVCVETANSRSCLVYDVVSKGKCSAAPKKG